MTSRPGQPGRTRSRTAPPAPIATLQQAMQAILGLSDSLDAALAYGRAQWAAGYRQGRAENWRCPTHEQDLRDARAAGAAAAAKAPSVFLAGWQAAMDRFADVIGGRLGPRPGDLHQLADTRWARARSSQGRAR